MTHTSLLVEHDSAYLRISTQNDSSSHSSINHALTHVAQEVTGLLQHTYPFQANDSNHAKIITIRAIEPEYTHVIAVEPLTDRESEVLQLIVDGCSNHAIAQELYTSTGTVKTHIHNILRKFCANEPLTEELR